MNVYCDRLDQLIERLGVKTIGRPTACRSQREAHGAKVTGRAQSAA